MSVDDPVGPQVDGERDRSAMLRVVSMQSRVSNILAFGLMALLGLASLTWYYATTLSRQSHAKDSAQKESGPHADGDLSLPSLGRIAPQTATLLPEPPPDGNAPARTLAEIPLAPSAPTAAGVTVALKTPAELALDRQLSGAVFAVQGDPRAVAGALDAGQPVAAVSPAGNPDRGEVVHGEWGHGELGRGDGSPGEHALTPLLSPTVTAAVRAHLLPSRRLLLPKGAFIDCTLETAIDSSLPGMTTCVMATDAFGADGEVVLLERGTKLIGETRGQVQPGAARIFVLWTEARTPTGVVVPLDSPGADELGRSGLAGAVNTHFWQRFGAAILVSVIEGGIQAAAESSNRGGGTVIVNPSASQDVLTEILKNTVGIPPTIVKNNGDRIQVLVARDLDFRSVYELHAATGR